MNALLPEWRASCEKAIELLDKAVSQPPPQMIDLTDDAMRKVIAVRDGVIERLRAEPEAPRVDLWRVGLSQVNVTLSELASIEYPGAINRAHLKQAISLLQGLLAEAEPHVKSRMDPLEPAVGITGTIEGGVAEEQVHHMETTSESLPETERLS